METKCPTCGQNVIHLSVVEVTIATREDAVKAIGVALAKEGIIVHNLSLKG